MAYDLRSYQAGDVLSVPVQPQQRGELIEGWREQWRTRRPAGPAMSLVRDGRAVVCGGIEPVTPWRGYFWLLASDGVGVSGWSKVLRTGRHMLAHTSNHRVESVANLAVPRFVRFLEKLGLVREGVMRRYGPNGEDFALYAFTREVI